MMDKSLTTLPAFGEDCNFPCADLEGGGVGGPDPPWNLQSLISRILLEMKKLVIFHIIALPQLYFKQNQSYLRLDPPLEKFSGFAPDFEFLRGNLSAFYNGMGLYK